MVLMMTGNVSLNSVIVPRNTIEPKCWFFLMKRGLSDMLKQDVTEQPDSNVMTSSVVVGSFMIEALRSVKIHHNNSVLELLNQV